MHGAYGLAAFCRVRCFWVKPSRLSQCTGRSMHTLQAGSTRCAATRAVNMPTAETLQLFRSLVFKSLQGHTSGSCSSMAVTRASDIGCVRNRMGTPPPACLSMAPIRVNT